MTAIRVLIVDDHLMVGEALARLLQQDPAIQVVGQAATAPAAISLARQLAPSVILMDIGLPGMDGVDATWTLRRLFPAIPVLVLTMFEQEAYVVEALRAGAAGYLVKTAGAAELVAAIRAVCAGKVAFHPRVASGALQRMAASALRQRDPFVLSRREIQILQLLIGGRDVRGISRELLLSPHTVRNHLKSIYRKLGVHGRAEAAVHALRRGLVKA